MKNLIIIGLTYLFLSIFSCYGQGMNQKNNYVSLSSEEVTLLKFMWEEEKLARDVYQYLYDKYEHFTFHNIKQSEQRHMDAALNLLRKYDIDTPSMDQYGVFNNSDLQSLYNQLITRGNNSLIEALKVGATIEDLDIKDLMEFINKTDNPDIVHTFNKLSCGSRNHMRAFVSNLNSAGENYTPQYISEELFDKIINGNHERCGKGHGKNR